MNQKPKEKTFLSRVLSRVSRVLSRVSLSDIIQIFIAFILVCTIVISAIVARNQLDRNAELAGNASWAGYVEAAINHPAMAAGYSKMKLDQISKLPPEERDAQEASYQWFVERMLFAGEEVLYATNDDPQWHLSIKLEAKKHLAILKQDYFTKDDFCLYRRPIRHILAELDQENPNLELKFASLKCPEIYD